MKKLLSLLLGIVVLALGFRIAYPADRLEYGRAKGSDAKIENASELSVFLSAMQNMQQTHVPTTSDQGTIATKPDYTSVSMEYIFHYDYSVNDASSAKKESCHLTEANYVYATREALCAHGTVLQKTSSESTRNGSTTRTSSYIDEDFSFYADAEKELYRYDKFNVMKKYTPSQTGTSAAYVLPAEFKGTWIKLDDSDSQKFRNMFALDSVSSVLAAEIKILNYCGNYLASRAGYFSQDGDKYVLLPSYFNDFLQSFPYDSSELKKAEDGTFTVDLSDHACPTFYFEVETGKNLHASWTIRFSNVNNTYVKLLPTKDEYRTTRDLFFSMGLD